MQFRTKLICVVSVAVAVMLAADGTYDVLREQALLKQSAAAELGRRAHFLRASLREAFRSSPEASALATLREINASDGSVRTRWIPPSRIASIALEPADRARLLGGEEVTLFRDGASAVGYATAALPDGRVGVLEVTQRIDDAHAALLTNALQQSVFESIVVLIVCAFVAGAGSHYLVTGPISKLRATAERIGEGDFEAATPLRQSDEIGMLSRAMHAMSQRLRRAREAFASEHEAHLTTLEALRHSERLSTVGRLASTVAHELGTPLNVIAVRAQMVSKGKDVEGNARIIREQAERMTRIIRNILGLARRNGHQLEAVDVGATVRKVFALTGHSARKRRVTQELDPRSEGVVAHGNQQQLMQVVLNMVMNAIEATAPGGNVDVLVKREPSQSAGADQLASLKITDTGAGIGPDVLPHIFEPFYTTKGPAEGTGLGLSIAHGIVKDWGGWIDVRSEVGSGTCFTIFLPMDPNACEAAS